MPIYTVTVSNVPGPGDGARTLLSALGVPGTAWAVVGGGGEWPIEPGARVECCITKAEAQRTLTPNLVKLLQRLGESAAYVTVDGKAAYLVHSTGEVTWLPGPEPESEVSSI